MKKLTAGTFITLAAIALAAPFFAMAVLVGVRAVELAVGAQENLLLLALVLLAAASPVLKARGDKAHAKAGVSHEGLVAMRRPEVSRAETRNASVLHLGW
jgi:hypothetical protein